MALNVVVALVYYLRWTALLFMRSPEPAAVTRSPAPLTAAIVLSAVLGLALSGAPQLVLRFATGGLL
jgi:NADH-quinone oxidoreductase subunit N